MPPILLKSYSWKETEQTVKIVVPLEGISKYKPDIFITDKYIKISQTPYFWEIFLKYEINHERSRGKICNGLIELNLIKKVPALWNEISEICPDGDKLRLIKRRQDEISKVQKSKEETVERNALRNRELVSAAVREQIKAEREEKTRIQNEITKMKQDAFKTILAEDKSQSQFNKTKVHPTSTLLPPIRKRANLSVHFTPSLTSTQETVQQSSLKK